MKNASLVVLSVLLLSLTFVITIGFWPVAVFWVSIIVVAVAAFVSLFFAFYVPYRLFDLLISKFMFGRLVSWFAVVSTSVFSYVITIAQYEFLGSISNLHDGFLDVSLAGPVVAGVVTGIAVIWGTVYAMQRSFGRR